MPENVFIVAIGDVPGLAGGHCTAAVPMLLYWMSWNSRAEGNVTFERIPYQTQEGA